MKSERTFWLDKPGNVTRIVYALYGLGALLFAGDLLYHKHVHFFFEKWVGFYAAFGFVACVALVIVAKWMRHGVMRDEDYYGDDRPLRRTPDLTPERREGDDRA